MNILFEANAYYPNTGGAESLIEDLSSQFILKGHKVTVVTQRYSRFLPGFENRNGINIIRLLYLPTNITPLWKIPVRIWRYMLVPFILFRFYGIMKKRKIDVVCLGLFGTGSLYILLLRYLIKFRLVVYIHRGEIREFVKTSKLIRWLLKKNLKICDAVIAVSNALKEETIEFAPFAKNKIHVIFNAVDPERIKMQEKYSYFRTYILFVGRLVPFKGVNVAIEAFKSIAMEMLEKDLLIVGTGPEEHNLRKTVSKYGLENRIKFLGEQNRARVMSFIKACEFLVLPSYDEGCPIVVLEAMAAGKMTIGSRVKGIIEVIEDGKNGVLFTAGDSEELGRLMLEFYSDKNKRLAIEKNIRDLNPESYDIRKISDEHLKVYRI